MPHASTPLRLLTLSFIILCFFSCGKEKIELLWEEQSSPVNSTLNSVYFTDINTGYAVGGDVWTKGYSLSTLDGGITWVADSLGDKSMFGLDFSNDGVGYAVGVDGYFYRKLSPQEDWTFHRLHRWDILRDVDYNEEGVGVVVGGIAFQQGAFMRVEGAWSMERDTFEKELAAVCFSDNERVHAAGYGIMLQSNDTGKTWTQLNIDGDFFRAIDFPSSNVGYVVGSGGTIMKTTNGGDDWKKIRKGEKVGVKDIPFRDVHFVDENIGYIVGEGGVFWRTLNGGDDWQEVKGFPDVDLLGVHVVDGLGYIVGEKGRIFRFEEGL